jgi:hypothetical protein
MNKRKLLKDYFEKIEDEKVKKATLGILEIQRESEISNTEKIRRMKGLIEKICSNED